MSFTLIAVHFVYRYFATCKPENIRFFRGFNIVIWLLGALFVSFFWGIASFLLYPETERTKRSLLHVLEESYGLDPLWIGNVPYSYWNIDENGVEHLNPRNIIGILQHCAIMTLSFSTVFYCGVQTHKKMKLNTGVSDRTKELQKQLFNALVLQTLIPAVLMYMPTIVTFVTPFFGINVGCYSNITTVTVHMYPAIDPLVWLFLIKDFRKSFLRIICLCSGNCTILNRTTSSYKLSYLMV
uniref:Uncharacterized protein n=1 Tax=Caenorhabditis japonica TaxID=281687 RepID=A0A8R1DSA9_CAEJA